MCTGFEILALASGAAGLGGSLMGMKAEQDNMARMAEARNNELRRTLGKNDKLAEQSRDAYEKRVKDASAETMDAEQTKAVDTRQAAMDTAIDSAPAAEPTISGSAPSVVKSELAKRMADTIAGSKAQAARSAKLGGYGDSWLSQGMKDVEAGRDIGQAQNFAQGNMAILPYSQDFAEARAYKPASPVGALLQGLGSIGSSFAGSQAGGVAKKVPYTKPPPSPSNSLRLL